MDNLRTNTFGIIVLNHNGMEDTLECLNSILSSEMIPKEIVLIDNGSTDGSPDKFTSKFSNDHRITLIFLELNTGYAAGNNVGINYLLKRDVDIICILNNDTIVRPDFLKALRDCFKPGSSHQIATPKILYADGQTIWSTGERIFYPLLISKTAKGKLDKNGLKTWQNINGITGCAMVVRKEVFERIGTFDENYFAYVEDVDFCKRAVDAGFKLTLCPFSIIIHKVARTTGNLSAAQLYLKTRNRAYFIKKNITPIYWGVAYGWYLMLNMFWILKSIFRKDIKAINAVKLGMIDFLRGKMGRGNFEFFI
jgi:GT2 family glycosyltransferase